MKNSGVFNVTINGGEPLIRKEAVYRIGNIGNRLGLFMSLGTNGVLLDKKTIYTLRDCGYKCIVIGVDGHNSEVHNYIRRTGDDQIIRKLAVAIETIKKCGMICVVTSIIHRKNITFISELINFVSSLNVDSLQLLDILKIGRACFNSRIFVSDGTNKVDAILSEIKLNGKLSVYLMGLEKFDGDLCFQCYAGKRIFGLSPNLSLSICPLLGYVSSDFKLNIEEWLTSDTLQENENIKIIRDNLKEFIKLYNIYGCPVIYMINESG